MSRPSIFITGAAAGIGRATALRFAREGWFVGLFDLDEAGVQALAAELGPEQAMAGVLNVAEADAWLPALATFFRQTRRLDLLLNNAGILASGPFGEIPLSRQHLIVDVNFKGVLNGCHAALPFLRQTPGARVINMASASAIYGQPSLATYSATKFAVRGFTEALDLEWQAFGIRVMDIMPLFVSTHMVDGMNAKSVKSLGVRLTAEDVAATIWEAAAYTGRTPRVHWTVGLQTRLFFTATGLSPAWVSRLLTRLIATDL
jgi:NAD(P)-dependent dehydrogenase (short-subunit alcohol dehydrogenase family)